MDVRLDQPATDEAPTGIIGLARFRQTALDRNDFAAGNTDIQRRLCGPIGKVGVTNDQIHATCPPIDADG
jgi:hypothetical protein